jgi:hypothetical protein
MCGKRSNQPSLRWLDLHHVTIRTSGARLPGQDVHELQDSGRFRGLVCSTCTTQPAAGPSFVVMVSTCKPRPGPAVKYDRGSPEEGARMGFAGNGPAVIGTGFIVPTGAAR